MKDQWQKWQSVVVEWVDSCEPASNAEVEDHEIPEPQLIYQCGYLVKETERSISVAGAWKPELETYDYVITIPKFAISKLIKLSEEDIESPSQTCNLDGGLRG